MTRHARWSPARRLWYWARRQWPRVREAGQRPAFLWGVAGVCVMLAAVSLTWSAAQADRRAELATAEKRDLGVEVARACAAGVVVQSPDGRDLCARAAEVVQNPEPESEPEPEGAEFDEARVLQLIRAELARNPPRDGRTPTAAEVEEAARRVLTAHPELFRGPQGEPGPGPTEAQVRAAAAAVMAADPERYRGQAGEEGERGPQGPEGEAGAPGRDGADGAPGRGIVDTAPDPADPCYVIVTYNQEPLTERWGPFCPPPVTVDPEPTPTTTPTTATTAAP